MGNFFDGCVRPMDTQWFKVDSSENLINERSVSGKITKKRIYQGTVSQEIGRAHV